MQLILQLLSLRSFVDKILDFLELDSAARFKSTGIMEDKAVGCWVLKLVFDIVFPALKNYIEYIIADDADRPDTDRC
jgi:hypothetical protein